MNVQLFRGNGPQIDLFRCSPSIPALALYPYESASTDVATPRTCLDDRKGKESSRHPLIRHHADSTLSTTGRSPRTSNRHGRWHLLANANSRKQAHPQVEAFTILEGMVCPGVSPGRPGRHYHALQEHCGLVAGTHGRPSTRRDRRPYHCGLPGEARQGNVQERTSRQGKGSSQGLSQQAHAASAHDAEQMRTTGKGWLTVKAASLRSTLREGRQGEVQAQATGRAAAGEDYLCQLPHNHSAATQHAVSESRPMASLFRVVVLYRIPAWHSSQAAAVLPDQGARQPLARCAGSRGQQDQQSVQEDRSRAAVRSAGAFAGQAGRLFRAVASGSPDARNNSPQDPGQKPSWNQTLFPRVAASSCVRDGSPRIACGNGDRTRVARPSLLKDHRGALLFARARTRPAIARSRCSRIQRATVAAVLAIVQPTLVRCQRSLPREALTIQVCGGLPFLLSDSSRR